MSEVTNNRDDPHQKGARIIEGKVGVVIDHVCFPNPVPIMGVRRGKFAQDVLPQFRFVLYSDGWHRESIQH